MSTAGAAHAAGEAPQPRTRRRARTRERILAAATEVFARRGFHGARVADIAEAAGIAYGLVYHHFRNKEEILAAIYSERWAMYVRYLDELGATPSPFAERLDKLVHFWVETFRNDPQLITVMINEISRSYEFLESHDLATVLVAFDAIEKLLIDARSAREVRGDLDPRLVTYAIVGIAEMVLTGYVIGTLARQTREQFARDERELISLLLEGLISR
jgi:TetR/AcrR family fatty acid metabolism transcriptional regulator